MKISNLGEFGLIDFLQKRCASTYSSSVVKGIGDDAAVLAPGKGKQVLFTTDALVEGVHFSRSMPPKAVGHKAMACNISDIAAMGGRPQFAVVALGMSPRTDPTWVKQLYAGMVQTAKRYNVAIVGGDMAKSATTFVSVAMIGETIGLRAVLRRGARVGDVVVVTGALGGSLPSGRHLRFQPRAKEAEFLVKHFQPTAMIDVSDGLSSDLGHILKSSGVGADIHAALIPRHKGATLNQALNDGEDFELIVTLPAAQAKKLLRDKTFHRIGTITSRKNVLRLLDQGNAREIPPEGYRHF